MPVPSIVTLAVAPPSGLRFTVVWKLPLPVLPALPPVVDCGLLVTALPPVERFSIWSPSDCGLLLDVPPLLEFVVPLVVPEVVELLLVVLLVVDEPEFVLFALEPDMLELPVMELLPVVELLLVELPLDVLLAAKELASVLELFEPPAII